MVEKSKHCSDVMKKCFKKELVMTKKNVINFENSTKCLICDMLFMVMLMWEIIVYHWKI